MKTTSTTVTIITATIAGERQVTIGRGARTGTISQIMRCVAFGPTPSEGVGMTEEYAILTRAVLVALFGLVGIFALMKG